MYDPKKAAEKQVRRAQEASTDYVNGVNDTQKNPMQRAKAKKEKLKLNFNQAVDNGTWEAGLDSVSFEEWKRLASTKGGERYASGVAASSDDIAAFHAEFAPHVQRVQAQIESMPDTTPEQRIARMVANARELGKFRRSKRRR
jgi:hypothetical protein